MSFVRRRYLAGRRFEIRDTPLEKLTHRGYFGLRSQTPFGHDVSPAFHGVEKKEVPSFDHFHEDGPVQIAFAGRVFDPDSRVSELEGNSPRVAGVGELLASV